MGPQEPSTGTLACISRYLQGSRLSSLISSQHQSRGREYLLSALRSLSAYGVKPHPVLRIFLYGPEHTLFWDPLVTLPSANQVAFVYFSRSAWTLFGCTLASGPFLAPRGHDQSLVSQCPNLFSLREETFGLCSVIVGLSCSARVPGIRLG